MIGVITKVKMKVIEYHDKSYDGWFAYYGRK